MFPEGFVKRMQWLLAEDWPAFEEVFSAPLTCRGLRVNHLKLSKDRLRNALPFSTSDTPFSPDGLVTDADFRAGSDPLHHAGGYYVQEPSAMSAVTILNPRPGERVLDLCAAPGGKSTQIAAALQGEGLLWCNEYVPARARALVQNLERCGVRNSVVTVGDTGRLPERLEGLFDAVLADVPCSGEGMFRKEPEATAQWSEDNIALCASRGQEILHNAARCVRPGGRLVLSTCTFAPEENEWAVVRFLRAHPDFQLVDCGVSFGRPAFDADRIAPFGMEEERAFSRTVPLEYCRRILPMDGGEGHFIALFVHAGEGVAAFDRQPAARETEELRAAHRLYEDCFTDVPRGEFALFGDTVRLLPPDLPALKGLSVLYAGVAAASVHRGRTWRVEPEHGVFQSAHADDCRRVLSLSADDERTTAFLKGAELSVDLPDGYTAVTVEGLTAGFGKASHGRLKNRYPKGLRLLG